MSAQAGQLPLWAPVMLGLGIACDISLPWAAQRWAVAGVAGAVILAAFALLHGRAARVCAWAGAIVLAGMAAAAWRVADVAAPILLEPALVEMHATIVSVDLQTGRGQLRLVVAPQTAGLPPRLRVTLPDIVSSDLRNSPGLQPGARVGFRARLRPPMHPAYPGGFDLARQAWFDGIGATGSVVGHIQILAPAPPPQGAAAALVAVRTRLSAYLQHALPGATGAIAAALATGDQGAIPVSVVQAMRDAGLAHLLSISGLHIAVVIGGAMWCVRRSLLLSPWVALHLPVRALAAAMAAIAGIAYTMLAGSEVPTVRACIATLIVLAGIVIGREAFTLRLVATAAFLILLVRPEALLGPSFQLSFAAVAGLVALYESRWGQWLHRRSQVDGWAMRLARGLVALLVSGLVAELMLSTTALFHFNRAGLYGIFANLVAIPLTSFVIMPLLILTLLLAPLGVPGVVLWGLDRAIALLIALAGTIAAWPGAVLRLPTMGSGTYALFVLGGLWIGLWRGPVRLAGLLPVMLAVGLVWRTEPPDLLVSADGRHVAILSNDRQLALLRTRGATYLRSAWRDATAADDIIAIADLPNASCSADACIIGVRSNDRAYIILATRTARPLVRARFEASCATADIVISTQRLPDWCAPRWLRLDGNILGKTDAVAIHLETRRIETVAAQTGDHPWQRQQMLPESLLPEPVLPDDAR